MVDPETVLNGSAEVVLDAREARLLQTRPRRSAPRTGSARWTLRVD